MTTAEEEFWESFYEAERKEDEKRRRLPKLTRVIYVLAVLVGVLLYFEITKYKGGLNVNSYKNNDSQTLNK